MQIVKSENYWTLPGAMTPKPLHDGEQPSLEGLALQRGPPSGLGSPNSVSKQRPDRGLFFAGNITDDGLQFFARWRSGRQPWPQPTVAVIAGTERRAGRSRRRGWPFRAKGYRRGDLRYSLAALEPSRLLPNPASPNRQTMPPIPRCRLSTASCRLCLSVGRPISGACQSFNTAQPIRPVLFVPRRGSSAPAAPCPSLISAQ